MVHAVQAAALKLKTDIAVVDSNALECPSPVPRAMDGGHSVVDSDVTDSESAQVISLLETNKWRRNLLLVADPDTEFPTVEDEITHVSTGAVFHVDTLVLRVCALGHLDDDVHERSGLGNLPVKTGRRASYPGQINFEIADRTEARQRVKTILTDG